MHSIRDLFGNAGLIRARDGRLLGGVVSGIGRRIGLGPWTARLLFVLALLLVGGTQIWIYPILWILMPSGNETAGMRDPESPLQT